MQKRGQFYIIAAVLIALIIITLTGMTTYAVIKSKPKTIYSLSSDLKKEGPRIVDFGIYKNNNLSGVIENFTDREFAGYFLLHFLILGLTLAYSNFVVNNNFGTINSTLT